MDKWTPYPECPHCGHKDHDWWDGTSMQFDSDSEERDCKRCEKPYRVTMGIVTEFSTEAIEDEPTTEEAGHE